MKPPRQLTKWIQQRLETMEPGEHFKVEAEQLGPNPKLIVGNIRSQVGRVNSFAQTNWRVHRDSTGLWIWNDPTPRQAKVNLSPLFDELVQLQKEHKQAQQFGQVEEEQQLAIKILDIVGKLREQQQIRIPKQKGAIYMPLSAVLAHIGVTKAIWDLLPPKEQLKRKIAAELEMKQKRQLESQSTIPAIVVPNNIVTNE